MFGRRRMQLSLLLAIICSLLIGSVSSDDENNDKHPVHFSEYKLRAVIEASNLESIQLRRDFVRYITDIYFGLKSDSLIGFQSAQETGESVPLALVLIGEEFADIVIKRHIIQRRLLAGLKQGFAKLLPMRTVTRLVEIFPSYSWLNEQSQVDIRPKFPDAKENQFVKLYSLIEKRARLRAADDILALTSDNMRRILKIVQWFVVDRKHDLDVPDEQIKSLASHANRIIHYYLDFVIKPGRELQAANDELVSQNTKLADEVGGVSNLLKFIDEISDKEGLDIHLSAEANSLDLPPTINEDMIDNLEPQWIPKKILDMVEADRKLLLLNRKKIDYLVKLSPEKNDAALANWCENIAKFICRTMMV